MQESLRDHVRVLAGEIGERNPYRPAALAAAAEYVEGRLAPHFAGRHARQTYRAAGIEVSNLIFEMPGDGDRPIVVVGAHYDSAPGTPGADDNASAVAGLIELARAFAARSTRHPFRFVAFTLEEPPFFAGPQMGSQVFVDELLRRGEDVRLMVCLEMIGYYHDGEQNYPLPEMRLLYPRQANFVAAVTDPASATAAQAFLRGFRSERIQTPYLVADLPIEGIDLSDHLSFWRAGLPALMVTDTAIYRNPHYHLRSDLPDTLDYERMSAAVEAVASGLEELDRD